MSENELKACPRAMDTATKIFMDWEDRPRNAGRIVGWLATNYIQPVIDAEITQLKHAIARENHDITQTLGKALGYPWFKDDPKNFPDATEADGVVVGDHVAASLASEAATTITQLKQQLENIKSASVRDGKWMDKYGACKVCDGEIPHGHSENCDLYKIEQQLEEAKGERDKYMERLCIDPGGSDKIDELESAAGWLRHEIETLKQQLDAKTEELEKMAAVLEPFWRAFDYLKSTRLHTDPNRQVFEDQNLITPSGPKDNPVTTGDYRRAWIALSEYKNTTANLEKKEN